MCTGVSTPVSASVPVRVAHTIIWLLPFPFKGVVYCLNTCQLCQFSSGFAQGPKNVISNGLPSDNGASYLETTLQNPCPKSLRKQL